MASYAENVSIWWRHNAAGMVRVGEVWVEDVLEAVDNMREHQWPQSWHHDPSQYSVTAAYHGSPKALIIKDQHHISYGQIQRAASNLICDQRKVHVVVL